MVAAVTTNDALLDLFAMLRSCAQARARAVAGWLDAYVHTLPPPERVGAAKKLIGIWDEHHRLWACRIDAAAATTFEHQLTSFDWLEIDVALRTLLRDLEGADAR